MYERMVLTCLVLFACVTLSSSAPVPKYRAPKTPDVTEQLKKLQGTWDLVYNEEALQPARAVAARGAAVVRSTTRVKIEGTRWSYVRNLRGEERVTTSYNMKIDPTKSPIWLDLVRDGMPTPLLTGILSIEGDTVRFCYRSGATATRLGQGRPTTFNIDERGTQTVMTLRRVAAP
jgi:uncharacterized protein (TIGR03067 family)